MPSIRISPSLFSAARLTAIARGPARLLVHRAPVAAPKTAASRFTPAVSAGSARFWSSHSALFRDASHSKSSPSVPDWGFHQIQGASRRLQDTELHGHTVNHEILSIIDVRETDEYNKGHIPGAINVPLSAIKQADESVTEHDGPAVLEAFQKALSASVPRKSKEAVTSLLFGKIEPSSAGEIANVEAVVYCRAGVRSMAAIDLLGKYVEGNEPPVKLHNYSGSWNDWTAKGGEVARPDLD